MRAAKSARGVTLIEIAVALAILAIVTALGVATMSGARPRMDVNSMSAQFAAKVGEAQVRALRNRRDVWLIIYVSGGPDEATENGGYFIYEPLSGTFNFAGYSVADGPAAQTPGDVVSSHLWFRPEIKSGRVSFADPPAAIPLDGPFAGTTVNQACTFCTDHADGFRGAMVFSPDGEVMFRNGDGDDSGLTQGVVTLTSNLNDTSGHKAIAVSATGLTRVTK